MALIMNNRGALDPYQTYRMKLFQKMVKDKKLVTRFWKKFHHIFSLCPKYASGFHLRVKSIITLSVLKLTCDYLSDEKYHTKLW